MEGETRQSERAETVTEEEKLKFVSAMRGHPLLATILPPSYRYEAERGRPPQAGRWTNNGQVCGRLEIQQKVEDGLARAFGFWPAPFEVRGVLDAIIDLHRHSTIYRFMHKHFAPRHGAILELEVVWDRWKMFDGRDRIPERELRVRMLDLGFRIEGGTLIGWCRLDTAPPPPCKPVQAAKAPKPKTRPVPKVSDGRTERQRLLERMEQLAIPEDLPWAQRYRLYSAAIKRP